MSSSVTLLQKNIFYNICHICSSVCFHIKPKQRCLPKVSWDKTVYFFPLGRSAVAVMVVVFDGNGKIRNPIVN